MFPNRRHLYRYDLTEALKADLNGEPDPLKANVEALKQALNTPPSELLDTDSEALAEAIRDEYAGRNDLRDTLMARFDNPDHGMHSRAPYGAYNADAETTGERLRRENLDWFKAQNQQAGSDLEFRPAGSNDLNGSFEHLANGPGI